LRIYNATDLVVMLIDKPMIATLRIISLVFTQPIRDNDRHELFHWEFS